MNQVQTYYKHSGNSTLRGMALVNLTGVACAVILGTLYGYASNYISYLLFKFFLTAALGGVLGFLIGKVAKFGQLRSKPVLFYFGFLFGLGAVYMGWVGWIYAFSKHSLLIFAPGEILNIIKLIAPGGAWTISGIAVKGLVLYLIWILEALIIIGVSSVVAGISISHDVFCEECNRWLKYKHAIYPMEPIPNLEEVKGEIETGNFESLTALQKMNPLSREYTRLELSKCPSCQRLCLLSVSTIKKYTTIRRQEKEHEQKIIQNFIIDSSTYQLLSAMDKPFYQNL